MFAPPPPHRPKRAGCFLEAFQTRPEKRGFGGKKKKKSQVAPASVQKSAAPWPARKERSAPSLHAPAPACRRASAKDGSVLAPSLPGDEFGVAPHGSHTHALRAPDMWMHKIQFAPKKPWNSDSPANANRQWFGMVSKWCRIPFIHSMSNKVAKKGHPAHPWTTGVAPPSLPKERKDMHKS